VSESEAAISKFSVDWGALSVQRPACVAHPSSIEQVQRVVVFARENGLTISVRGNGHSTGAQTLNSDQIVIDTSLFNAVSIDATARIATVGAGATWLNLIAAASAAGLRPEAFVDTIGETTIGGVISTGGTSAAALSVGLAIDAVASFDCVDGTGKIYNRVSRDHHARLFASVRGGLGQFAVATTFRIRLVPLVEISSGVHVRLTSYALFNPNDVFQLLAAVRSTPNLDGADVVSVKADANLLAITIGDMALANALAAAAAMAMAPYVHFVNVVDFVPLAATVPTGGFNQATLPFLSFASRTLTSIAAGKNDVSWFSPKVVRAVFVPNDERIASFVGPIIAKISEPQFLVAFPGCQLSLKLLNGATARRDSVFRLPRTDNGNVISVEVNCLDDLTAANRLEQPAQRVLRLLAELDVLFRNGATIFGASSVKAYPWNTQFDCWADHFAEAWGFVVRSKRQFDPCALFNRGVGIFPQTRNRVCAKDIAAPFQCDIDSSETSDSDISDLLNVDSELFSSSSSSSSSSS
jgi:hypothetical protein